VAAGPNHAAILRARRRGPRRSQFKFNFTSPGRARRLGRGTRGNQRFTLVPWACQDGQRLSGSRRPRLIWADSDHMRRRPGAAAGGMAWAAAVVQCVAVTAGAATAPPPHGGRASAASRATLTRNGPAGWAGSRVPAESELVVGCRAGCDAEAEDAAVAVGEGAAAVVVALRLAVPLCPAGPAPQPHTRTRTRAHAKRNMRLRANMAARFPRIGR
jgi:hypothetical protein